MFRSVQVVAKGEHGTADVGHVLERICTNTGKLLEDMSVFVTSVLKTKYVRIKPNVGADQSSFTALVCGVALSPVGGSTVVLARSKSSSAPPPRIWDPPPSICEPPPKIWE